MVGPRPGALHTRSQPPRQTNASGAFPETSSDLHRATPCRPHRPAQQLIRPFHRTRCHAQVVRHGSTFRDGLEQPPGGPPRAERPPDGNSSAPPTPAEAGAQPPDSRVVLARHPGGVTLFVPPINTVLWVVVAVVMVATALFALAVQMRDVFG